MELNAAYVDRTALELGITALTGRPQRVEIDPVTPNTPAEPDDSALGWFSAGVSNAYTSLSRTVRGVSRDTEVPKATKVALAFLKNHEGHRNENTKAMALFLQSGLGLTLQFYMDLVLKAQHETDKTINKLRLVRDVAKKYLDGEDLGEISEKVSGDPWSDFQTNLGRALLQYGADRVNKGHNAQEVTNNLLAAARDFFPEEELV